MEFIIKLPLKPHVKKYLQAHFPVEPFYISKSNHIGVFLYNCLERVPRRFVNNPATNTTWQIGVRHKYIEDKGLYISKENVTLFNSFVEDLMRDELYKTIDMGLDHHQEVKEGILQFCKKYDIAEDELTYSSLHRYYYRRRNSA